MAKKKANKSAYENLQQQITDLTTALKERSGTLSKKARKEYKVQLKALKKQSKPLQQAYEEVQIQQAGFTAAYDALASRLFESDGKKKSKKKDKSKKDKKSKNSKKTKLVVKKPSKNMAAAKDAKAAGIEGLDTKPRKRGPGRPPKNTNSSVGNTAPAKRGRPAGSKNKSTDTNSTKGTEQTAPTTRKRGRPVGSKNKATDTTSSTSSTDTTNTTKTTTGRRGRPAGSKNKPRASTATGAATASSTTAPQSNLTKAGTPRKKPGPKPKGTQLPRGRKADGSEDLTVINGIGPSVEKRLIEGGINSFRTLAKASTTRMKALIANCGPRYRNYDPSHWREEAKLAAAGKWDEMK